MYINRETISFCEHPSWGLCGRSTKMHHCCCGFDWWEQSLFEFNISDSSWQIGRRHSILWPFSWFDAELGLNYCASDRYTFVMFNCLTALQFTQTSFQTLADIISKGVEKNIRNSPCQNIKTLILKSEGHTFLVNKLWKIDKYRALKREHHIIKCLAMPFSMADGNGKNYV